MARFALIGAGKSAKKLIENLNNVGNFDLFTSTGDGYLYDVMARPLKTIEVEKYTKIYLAIYDYAEVLPYFANKWTNYIYWYDAITNELSQITDPNKKLLALEKKEAVRLAISNLRFF
jgi:hypothetical protein